MTREEAMRLTDVNYKVSPRTVSRSIVTAIYDDFESRICENCKRYVGVPDSMGSEMYCEYLRHGVALDFGCSEFKRKEV